MKRCAITLPLNIQENRQPGYKKDTSLWQEVWKLLMWLKSRTLMTVKNKNNLQVKRLHTGSDKWNRLISGADRLVNSWVVTMIGCSLDPLCSILFDSTDEYSGQWKSQRNLDLSLGGVLDPFLKIYKFLQNSSVQTIIHKKIFGHVCALPKSGRRSNRSPSDERKLIGCLYNVLKKYHRIITTSQRNPSAQLTQVYSL